MDVRIELALDIVDKELATPLSVHTISARMGLSQSRFEHLFKAETGQAFRVLVRQHRMEKSKVLLIDPTLRIKEVATAVGYSFSTNFTRDFRKHFGKSPSHYRIPSA